MCGIAGAYSFNGKPVTTGLAKKMAGRISYRGPDMFGQMCSRRLQLASSRLNVIDIEGGRQPINSEDGAVTVVCNGEISNYRELTRDLKARGHIFRSKTDVEVLVHLYEEKGIGMVSLLNGQFAFALWDENKKRLCLARDRNGICPLYTHEDNGIIYFSSEIKSFLEIPGFSPKLNLAGIGHVLRSWSTVAPQTTFIDVHELPPGWLMEVDQYADIQKRQFFSLSALRKEPFKLSTEQLTEKVREAIFNSVERLLVADVPVGSYLSGGIDSTIIAAIINKVHNKELTTFSVGFEDPDFDETPYQNLAVKSLKGKHVHVNCSYADIAKVFPLVVYHAEKPLFRTAPAPLFLLSKTVREHGFKVVLTGEGADEVFWGYDTYRELFIRNLWARNPGSNWRPSLLKEIFSYIPQYQSPRTFKFLVEFYKKSLHLVNNPCYSMLPRWQNGEGLFNIFQEEHRHAFKTYDFNKDIIRNLPEDFDRFSVMEKCQTLEMQLLLNGYLLSSQGDRMLMANSIEGRFPYLDNNVMALAMRLPGKTKLKGLKDKYILRESFKGFINEEIRTRSKFAYRAPDAMSFFGDKKPEYVESLLTPAAIQKAGIFDPGMVTSIKNKCERQVAAKNFSTRDNLAITFILSTQILDYLFVQRGNINDLV